MATIETLSIEVAAQTEQAERALDDLSEEAVELSVAFQSTSASASRAEDEIEEAGDSASASAAQFSGASLSLFGLSVSATTAATALFGLGAAFAAVATAGLGLLGVLGAVGGAFGILGAAAVAGNVEALQEELAAVADRIMDAIAPLSEVLGPLLFEAIRALPRLTENIVAAIGGAEEFRQTARLFGETLFEVIPTVIGLMFDVAEAALPAINRAIRALNSGLGAAIFDRIAATTRELLPELKALGAALIDFLPAFIEFGATVANLLLPALTVLLRLLTVGLNIINALPGPLDELVVGVVALSIAFGGLSTTLTTTISLLGSVGIAIAGLLGPIGLLAAALGVGLAVAWEQNWLGIRDITRDVINTITGFIDGLLLKIDELQQGLADVAADAGDLPGVGAVNNAVDSFTDAAGNVADPIQNGITGASQTVGLSDGGGGTNVEIGTINASGRREGRQARNEIQKLSGNTRDTSRSE